MKVSSLKMARFKFVLVVLFYDLLNGGKHQLKFAKETAAVVN